MAEYLSFWKLSATHAPTRLSEWSRLFAFTAASSVDIDSTIEWNVVTLSPKTLPRQIVSHVLTMTSNALHRVQVKEQAIADGISDVFNNLDFHWLIRSFKVRVTG